MNHDKDYPVEFINQILQEVKTIAIVGASKNPKKFSYEVLRVLHETGYNVIPVNPKEESNDIYGLKCYGSLSSIQQPVDMVDIFRNSEAVYEVTEEAIKIAKKIEIILLKIFFLFFIIKYYNVSYSIIFFIT